MLKSIDTQTIVKCRHAKEKPLFSLGVIVTFIILLVVAGASFCKETIIDLTRSDFIEDYRGAHPSAKELSDAVIVTKLSKEDMLSLELLKFYYWPVALLLPLTFFSLLVYMIGGAYGKIRGNSVRLDEKQYPEVYKMFAEMSEKIGLKQVPELYLVSGGGTLNAYATCLPGYRNFSVIYSDILERCLRNNDLKSLRFILGHELGHIKYNHVKWWYNFATAWMVFPGVREVFGLPLSRSREYGCDKLGEKLSGDSEGRALTMLTAGKYAYQDIDIEAYMQEHFEKPSFWAWVANLRQDHGLLSWRIAALRKKHQAGLIFRNKK